MIAALLFAGATSLAASAPACAAAGSTLALDHQGGQQILFASGPADQWAHQLLERPDIAAGWRGKSPSPETLQALKSATIRSAVDCANVRERALRDGKLIEDQAIVPTLDRVRLKSPRITVHRLTLPVIGPDGTQALYIQSLASNQVGGDAWLVLLERGSEGRWREAGRKLLFLG
jgi:hypothetical protein